ncbi:MAG: ABC transporter permease subunit, partial [Lachnospiraceae bacterium]|nr:ABC transporter permease subunit [Lachnospiraceae bacterium]
VRRSLIERIEGTREDASILLSEAIDGGSLAFVAETKKDVMSKVILPGSLPMLVSNMKVNIGLCLVGVIIGEFLSAKAGLGYLIIYASQTFKMDWMLMSIVILCLVSTMLYQGVHLLEKKFGNG